MRIIRNLLCAAAAAVALAGSLPAPAEAQAQAAAHSSSWRGSRNERVLNQAVRHYGLNPNRLTRAELAAIDETWVELLGSRGRTLTRRQATAIVYMALVFPYEDERGPGYGGGYDRPGDGYDGGYDRPGDGYDRPGYWGHECLRMEADAYQLGNVVSAPEHGSGLFIGDADKRRARTLAQEIQRRAVECRAPSVADRAGDVLRGLSEHLPERTQVGRQVDALKQAIRAASPDRGRH